MILVNTCYSNMIFLVHVWMSASFCASVLKRFFFIILPWTGKYSLDTFLEGQLNAYLGYLMNFILYEYCNLGRFNK